MKGVKYNLTMKLPQDEIYEKKEINMKELIKDIEEKFKTRYFLDDIIITNQIIYNIVKRPMNCSKLLRNKLTITRVKAEDVIKK